MFSSRAKKNAVGERELGWSLTGEGEGGTRVGLRGLR